MDICHHKNVEFEPKLKKYKGKVVFRSDIVEDDHLEPVQFSPTKDHHQHK